MERRVKLETITRFELSEEEIKHLYTIMALIQYPYECDPNYRDARLIRRLKNDFQRFNQEIIKACESDPNNLVLDRIRLFMQRHYGYVKLVAQGLNLE